MGKEYTIFSFDLPYHGEDTAEKTEIPVDLEDIRAYFYDFFNAHNISTFTSIGFSIGAKLSLALLELFPEKTERMLLIAPDGFRTNHWYKLATGSAVTRSLFRHFINHPESFLRLSDTLVRTGIIPRGLARFARSQMSSVEKRQRVYFTWIYFRRLQFRQALLVHILATYKIPVEVFLGSDDQIITPGHFRFLKNNPDIYFRLNLLGAGHNHLIAETARHLSDRPA